ncbi:MAG: extracellular solute-binding protein [Spirochaetes bacterium]|nr:extracellular solute-binding protein [Spirochaetota bacterium]MBU0954353.1 extracellular solute-binding protein [Spirochaetota bacterium]
MKRRIAIVALLLAVLVSVMPVFAAGTKDSTETAAMPTKITAYLNRVLIAEDARDAVLAKHKELTGVELEVVMPPHGQYSQVLTTSVMAGDIPDIMELTTADYPAYAAQGLLVPLDDFIRSNPNTAKLNPATYAGYRMSDGKVYGIPTWRGGGCVTYIRADWLRNVGMSVPITWDDYVKVLRAFTFNDPDRNGQKDTVGLAMPFQSGWEFDYYNRFIMQEAYLDFVNKNGRWYDGFTQPEMVAALERWIQLYKEGIIDPEFFTDNTGRARTKIMEGQAGVLEHWVGTWGSRLHAGAKNIDPNADLVAIRSIQGTHYVDRIGQVLSIAATTANPKAVFDNIVGTMWDQGEGQILWTYGVEGIHWQKAPAGSGYEFQMLPQPSNPDRSMQKSFIDPPLALNLEQFPVKVAQDPRDAESLRIHALDSRPLSILSLGKVGLENIGELRDAKREIFSKIVMGTLSIQDGLAQYRTIAERLNITTILTELNS